MGVDARPAAPTGALPDGVAEHVGAAAAQLARAPGVLSVVLLGSAARGELSAARVDGRQELFSDIELLVVTRGRLPGPVRRALAADVDRLAAGWGYRSPLFHVDLVFRERARLGSLPPFVFTHELRVNGRTLHGPDVRAEIRPVTLASLDRRNTHEILMKRLWALAEALPAAWLDGLPLDALGARALGVTLWRNALDVPTALLPDAGVLLPTYGARVDRWRGAPALGCRTSIDAAVGADSGAFLAACLAARAAAAASPDPAADHARVAGLIAAGVLWAALDGDPARAPGRAADVVADAAQAIPTRSRQVFNERPVTPAEWLAVARQSVRIANSTGAGSAIRWLRLPRKGHLCAGLLELHRALIIHHADPGDPSAGEALRAAARWLAPVAAGPGAGVVGGGDAGPSPTDAPTFSAAWRHARLRAARAFWRAVRLAEPAAWRRLAAAVGPAAGGGDHRMVQEVGRAPCPR